MTLELYVKWLVSIGQDRISLSVVLSEYAKVTAFAAYADRFASVKPYVISQAAIDQVAIAKKISAIKIVRQELADSGREYGLKIAKDIVDAYVVAHPELASTPSY